MLECFGASSVGKKMLISLAQAFDNYIQLRRNNEHLQIASNSSAFAMFMKDKGFCIVYELPMVMFVPKFFRKRVFSMFISDLEDG
jgi:hypothetical protein